MILGWLDWECKDKRSGVCKSGWSLHFGLYSGKESAEIDTILIKKEIILVYGGWRRHFADMLSPYGGTLIEKCQISEFCDFGMVGLGMQR